MEISSNVDTTCLSSTYCQDQIQGEVQVKLLKKSMDLEKAITSQLLQSMGVGSNIDTVA